MKVVFPLGVPPLLFCDDCGAFCGPAAHTRHPGHKLCPEHAHQHELEKVWRYRAKKRAVRPIGHIQAEPCRALPTQEGCATTARRETPRTP